ncbi:tetratricopeptide repeat protein [Pedobacter yulinensis]|nr:tetratricopeptide repeat protein [Pedobacter yulinensis]
MRTRLFSLLMVLALGAAAQSPVPVHTDSNSLKQIYFAGLRKKMVENFPEAEKDFGRIAAADANYHAAWYELASLAFKQNKVDEAEAHIKKATALQPGNEWYWILLAEIYKRKGDMAALTAVFDKLIALAPAKDGYYFDRANALFLGGKTDEALKAYQLLEQKFGNSEALEQARDRIRLHGQPAPGDAELGAMLSKGPGDVNSYLYLSGMLMQKGKSAAALKLLKQAQALQPENYEIDLALADAFRLEKDEPASEAALARAFGNQLMPVEGKLKTLAAMIGAATTTAKKVQLARWAGAAADLHADEPRLQALYADILYRTGRLAEAELRYKSALQLSENMYTAWEQLAAVQLAQHKNTDAIKTAGDALLLYPNQGSTYLLLARAHAGTGNAAEADRQLAIAEGMAAGNRELVADCQALKAGIRFAAKDYREARRFIEMALKNNNRNTPVYLEQLGDILYMLGDKPNALVNWQKARLAGNDDVLLKRKIDEKEYIGRP